MGVTVKRVHARIPVDLAARIDKLRGITSREAWIRDRLENIVAAEERGEGSILAVPAAEVRRIVRDEIQRQLRVGGDAFKLH